MAETCCCGCCTLSSATIIAIAFSIIESVYGLFWNVQLWLALQNKNDALLDKIINVNHITDFEVVHGLCLAAIGINIFWIIFAILAIRANARLHRGLLTPWIIFTYLLTLFDIGTTIYFVVKFQEYYRMAPIFYIKTGPTTACTYLVLSLLFSKGVIFWFINSYLAYVVEKRGKEIDHNNSLLALYIMSHLSRGSMDRRTVVDAPPPYCPATYSPKCITSESNSLESSWRLDIDRVPGLTGFANPVYPRFAQISVGDLRSTLPSPRNNELYRSLPNERSVRHEEGVFP